jgi:putative membrane protein
MSARWLLVPLLIAATVIAIFVGASLFFHGVYPNHWYPWPFFGWWFFIPVFFLVFFGFRFFFWWGPRGRWYGEEDQAIEILKQRFARGEISRYQFEQMKKDLER